MSKIICIGKNVDKLESLKALISQVLTFVTIQILTDEQEIMYEIDHSEVMLVISQTNENGFDGIALAQKIHDTFPQTKLIFVTSNPNLALDAFKVRAVGYLLDTDLNAQTLKDEFDDLGISADSVTSHKLTAKTFGNFELLCDGKAVKFTRAKSKELIAYLIDKRGTSASSSELIVNLWEDRDVDRTTRSMLQNLIADIRLSFKKYGILDFLDTKRNSFRIDDSKVECDYYELLSGSPTAVKQFVGEYMNSYSWAEMTAGYLCDKVKLM